MWALVAMSVFAVAHGASVGTQSLRGQSKLALDGKNTSADVVAGQKEDLLQKYLDGIFQLSYSCEHPVRLGRDNDGGYVVCEDAKIGGDKGGACQLFTFGIWNDDSFEQALHERHGCAVEEFDPTIKSSPGSQKYPESIHLHLAGISGSGPAEVKGLGKVDSLQHHIAQHRQKGKALFLKIDVEESEWDALSSVPASTFESIDQFVVEFHMGVRHGEANTFQTVSETVDKYKRSSEEDQRIFASRVKVVETLRQHFYLHHTHGTNCEGGSPWAGVGRVPVAWELSFIRKGLVVPKPGPFERHDELDQRCRPDWPELTPESWPTFKAPGNAGKF